MVFSLSRAQKYVLSTCYWPGTNLGAMDTVPGLTELTFY